MKALVLAGGSGTRLRPFTHAMPKQLIPVANRPVLAHVLDSVRDLGVTDVGIIVGRQAGQIRRAIGDGARLGLRVTYIRQDRPLGLAHAVRVARPFLAADPFVLYLGDNLLADGVAEVAAGFRRDRPDAALVTQRVTDPRRFGVVELAGDGTVRRLVEKPEQPASDLALVGVYFLSPAIHAAVAAIRPSGRGELELTDALQWLVAAGARVVASEYRGYWSDVGGVADVLACNRYLLARMPGGIAGDVDAASVVEAGVVVEPGARVRRSRVEAPAIIGVDAVVEDSHIGPGTAVGAGCQLHGARVADSVLLDGARLATGTPLTGSILGRGSTVDIGAAPGLRLVVGDHSRVELAG